MHKLAILAILGGCADGAVVLTRSMKTISHAVKGVGYTGGTEMELFSSNIGEAGVVTEQWWSIFGGDHRYDGGADPLIRIYYDGVGSKPSIEFRLFMAHGMGPIVCGDDYAAQKNCIDPAVTASDAGNPNDFKNGGKSSWGSELLGHGSTRGAHKNTYRIPYGAEHGIKITMEMPFDGVVYYYIRGMTNYPLIVGDLQLPAEARLRLYSNINTTVQPHSFLPLVPRRNSSGLLFQVTLAAASNFIGFMEGCVRAHIDDGNATGTNASALPPLLLSSGTEDYFEGANFFDTGLMQSLQAGVTWVNGTNPGPYAMSAYKHHVRDPVVWWDTFELTARNYDTDGVVPGMSQRASPAAAAAAGGGAKYYRGGANMSFNFQPVTMSSYAWTYEW